MEIKIGENIKRLRKAKGVTQEQIGELLGISVTAVSKWERNETYPDITLLFPLAHYFGITLDELMGYDEEKVQADIDATLSEFRTVWLTDPAKATEIIVKAYHDYPEDYTVMHHYMWHLAGDMADNDNGVLLAHKEEFSGICEKILNGCTVEPIRLNAWNMKAKLLHAEGKTEEALQIYEEKYPSRFDTKEQKKEQLFAKDTPEFKALLKQNLYALTVFVTDKKMKDIWFCTGKTVAEKAAKSLQWAEGLLKLAGETGDGEPAIGADTVCRCLEGYLARFGAEGVDTAAVEECKKAAALACKEAAERDAIN